MLNGFRTYRLAPVLLAFAFVLAGAGPLVDYLCAEAAVHACCKDGCPDRSGVPTDDAPAAAVCCALPAAPAETTAIAAPAAPHTDGALFAVAVAAWEGGAENLPVVQSPPDTESSPPPVRSHLSFSVLLI